MILLTKVSAIVLCSYWVTIWQGLQPVGPDGGQGKENESG
jgi:hypothetical protein